MQQEVLRRPLLHQQAPAASQPTIPVVLPLEDLPRLIMEHVASCLDPLTRRTLRCVDRACKDCMDHKLHMLELPLDHLKHVEMDQLAAQYGRASCMVLNAPQQRITLSTLGYRRRCEQLLAVFLDNAAPWSSLQALDLSTALSSISVATLELLVQSLGLTLHHLALPSVAAKGGQAEVLQLLGQLPVLQTLQVDCNLFPEHNPSDSHDQTATAGHTDHLAAVQVVCVPKAQALALNSFETASIAAPIVPATTATAVAAQHSLSAASSSSARVIPVQPPIQQHLHSQQQSLLTNNSASALQRIHDQNPSTSRNSSTCIASTPIAANSTSGSCSNNHSSSSNSSNTHTNTSNSSGAGDNRPDTYCLVSRSDSATDSEGCIYSSSSSSSSNSSSGSGLPQQSQEQSRSAWSALSNLTHLQQLQVVHPRSLLELLPALTGLQELQCVSLVQVGKEVAGQLLDPGFRTSEWQGLRMLSKVQGLTRLELGFGPQGYSCSPTAAASTPRLVFAPHVLTSASSHSTSSHSRQNGSASSNGRNGDPAVGVAAQSAATTGLHSSNNINSSSYQCAWSHLTSLQVLVLTGICLDSAALAATAALHHLTELQVSSLELEHDLLALPGLLCCSSSSSSSSSDNKRSVLASINVASFEQLKVLAVGQHFSLGPNSAKILFPSLEKLSIKDSSSNCPDLSCLKHHPSLVCFEVEAAGPCWQLAALQLSYLVHLPALRQLSLASSTASCRSSSNSHWLPSCSLSQVTSLTLSGTVTDHSLSLLPTQFPGLMALQLLGSYYVSDWGLKQLGRSPQLAALLLQGCQHITSYGLEVLLRAGALKALVVQDCSGIDAKVCQRIRRSCRYSSTALHWYGGGTPGGSTTSKCGGGGGQKACHSCLPQSVQPAATGLVALANDRCCGAASSIFGTCSSGSSFLERCWREAHAQSGSNDDTSSNSSSSSGSSGSSSRAPGAADCGSQGPQGYDDWSRLLWSSLLPPEPISAGTTPASSNGTTAGNSSNSSSSSSSSCHAIPSAVSNSSHRGDAGVVGCSIGRLGAGSSGYQHYLLQQQSYGRQQQH